jgi:GTPase SAR1 family protein
LDQHSLSCNVFFPACGFFHHEFHTVLLIPIHPHLCISHFQVIQVIEKRADQLDYVLVDTPGQIEIFTWSASGAIITEAFASTFPTVVAYVVDTPRSSSPVTFMSNMLYACSILYKTRLPLVLVFNKTDVAQHQFAIEV